eukprot:CAMPEP_0170489430 /NCGR_PEP_ID=MMETSP0208-20121228/7786_1 /TAXON_ID=197538 /ORGANISM="Strombidium inclinatum, Strain S3" /LENGTH=36 /DNA_ID= /DNA_START= /DNA_END= /DNA_ORIENTATION=
MVGNRSLLHKLPIGYPSTHEPVQALNDVSSEDEEIA